MNQGDGVPVAVGRAVALLSEAAVLTALLYYFGWVRTQAIFGYFGIDATLLGFSVTDYVLRSVNAAFLPLIVFGLVVLLLNEIHRRVVVPALAGRWSRVTPRVVARGMTVATVGCVVLAGVVAVGMVALGTLGVALPLALAATLGYLGCPSPARATTTGTTGFACWSKEPTGTSSSPAAGSAGTAPT